jgi:hypothetical protein
MAARMKVRMVGNPLGLIVSKEVADQLRVGEVTPRGIVR